MSATLATAVPRQPRRETPQRHIEIVTSRHQRRARPRLVHSLVIVSGLFTVLVAQLLLSIALADGAYQISALQTQQKEAAREQQAVTEELNVLNSPQNLAARAESLGLVAGSGAVYLNLADGAVLGSPTPAKAGTGSAVRGGELLIANNLLASAGAAETATTAPATTAPTTALTTTVPSTAGAASNGLLPGAPAGEAAAGSVVSAPGLIAAPVTH